mgnify:CR=1 FL=1|jgi:hypothetical protein
MRNVANEKKFVMYQVFKKFTNKDTMDLCETIIKTKKMLLDSLQEEIIQGIQLNCEPPLIVRQRGYSRNEDEGYYYGANM